MSVTASAPHTDTPARLRATIARLHRHLRPTAAGTAAGLTPTKISLLLTVVREGPIRLSDLADRESLNPTMLSRSISKLVERMRRERTDVLSVALDGLSSSERRALERALPALERLAEELKTAQPPTVSGKGGRS